MDLNGIARSTEMCVCYYRYSHHTLPNSVTISSRNFLSLLTCLGSFRRLYMSMMYSNTATMNLSFSLLIGEFCLIKGYNCLKLVSYVLSWNPANLTSSLFTKHVITKVIVRSIWSELHYSIKVYF